MSHWKWNNWTFRFQEITSGTNQRKTRCGRIGHMLRYFSVIREKCNKNKRIETRKPPRRKIPSILDSREDKNNRPYLARIMHGYLSTDRLLSLPGYKTFSEGEAHRFSCSRIHCVYHHSNILQREQLTDAWNVFCSVFSGTTLWTKKHSQTCIRGISAWSLNTGWPLK